MRTFPHLSKAPNKFGSYEIVWSEQIGDSWRSKRKSTGTGDKTEAEAALARFLQNRNTMDTETARTVSQVFEIYIRQHSAPRGNEVSDRGAMRAPLGAFGNTKAGLIRDDDIEAYTRRRLKGTYASDHKFARKEKGVKPSTIRREITALQAVLNWGSGKKMIPGGLKFNFPKPSDGAPREKWLTEDQEQVMLTALTEESIDLRIFVRLALTYGARRGAIMDLMFGPQVNFIAGSIDFNVPGKRPSRKRRPTVPMTKTIRADLEEAFKLKGRGARVCDWNTPARFEAFVKRIGFGWVTPHVLKHTAITLMLRNGTPPGDVSKITSTDLRTIYRVYRHHTHDELVNVIERRGI